MADARIIDKVKYFSQRDNKNDPYSTCYNTSMAMVIQYILDMNNTTAQVALGCPDNMQLEDFLYQIIYSKETKQWVKDNVKRIGTWILSAAPQTTAAVEEYVFNKLMKDKFKIECKFIENATYETFCDLIDENALPQILHGKYLVKRKLGNKYLGHVTCGIGYNKKKRTFYVNDPYGDWRKNYDEFNGREVEYPFGDIYIKNGTHQTMWLTSFRKIG